MEIKGLKIDTSRLRNLLGNFKGVSKLSEIRPETRTYDVQTSLTTDYRKNNWGLGRIVLDGISNHLPEDSGGTRTTVKIKQGGVYRDLKSADPSVAAEEVVFEDDGKGFDSGLLGLLYSTKAADTMSVGQFGEGLKMISAAALRAGQEIEFKSKNWSAVPFAQDETVGGNALKRLCFRVSENGHHLQGSRTVFKKPSKTLLEEVFKIPENVLAFNDSYRELPQDTLMEIFNEYSLKEKKEDIYGHIKDFMRIVSTETKSYAPKILLPPNILQTSSYRSRIIDLQNGKTEFFVKGIRVHDLCSIFSYDLGLNDITPDRIYANREKMLSGIELLLMGSKNPEVIDKVLKAAGDDNYRSFVEFDALGNRNRLSGVERDFKCDYNYYDNNINLSKTLNIYLSEFDENMSKSAWAEGFERVYGKNAVIASGDTNVNTDAELMGFKPVRLNKNIGDYLQAYGVQSAKDIKNEKQYRWIDEKDLTEEERKMISLSGEIDAFLGNKKSVPVRVYSGVFMQSGREITSNPAVYVTEENGIKYIGIRRDVLKDPMQFIERYVHEKGHDITSAVDYSRDFAEFFIERLAKEAANRIGLDRTQEDYSI